jgi:hypothetical protein
MQQLKPAVVAAISGAIQEYLQSEEAAWAAAAARLGPPGPPLNVWALAGRQTAMQWRLLAQRRALR